MIAYMISYHMKFFPRKAHIVRTNYDIIDDIICNIINDIIDKTKIYVNYYYMILLLLYEIIDEMKIMSIVII